MLQANLVKACEGGDLDEVKRLIRDGASPHHVSSDGKHPFGAALYGLNIDVVEYLDSLLKLKPEGLRKIFLINNERYGTTIPHMICEHVSYDALYQLYESHPSSMGFARGTYLYQKWKDICDIRNMTSARFIVEIEEISKTKSRLKLLHRNQDGKKISISSLCRNSSNVYKDKYSSKSSLSQRYQQQIKVFNQCCDEVNDFINEHLKQKSCSYLSFLNPLSYFPS